MPFEHGNRANPGGRPRKSEEQKKFETRCREWGGLFAFDKLEKWSNHKDPKVATWALGEILDRGFGKSVATSIVDATVTEAVGSSVEDIGLELTELVGGAKAEGIRVDSQDSVDTGK